jgi:hypothetical protein
MLDVAIVYYFGLDLNAIFSVIRLVVVIVILFLTFRIPFKRTYHWMFLVLTLAVLYYSSIGLAFQLATNATTFLAIDRWNYLDSNRLLALLVFQFAVYFVVQKPKTWMKLVLAGGYVYVATTTWIPFFIDPSFVITKAFETTTGWVSGPGTGDAYTKPYGVDFFVVGMTLFAIYPLVRYYRSEKSPLFRGQALYLIVGTAIITFSNVQGNIARATGTPSISPLIFAVGLVVLLLGLQRKGFYSVTPVAETAPIAEPIRYPLQEGHSYLSQDPKAAFQAFSEQVRSGREGFLITRIFPTDVRKDYLIQTTPIRWLAESKGQDVIPPGDLLGLSLTIKDFMEKASKPVVMLHGIEYLTSYDGFSPVLKLIQGLSEANATRRGILILPVLPDSLNKQDEVLLSSETTPMPMPVASQD